jgi:hypothetical protein
VTTLSWIRNLLARKTGSAAHRPTGRRPRLVLEMLEERLVPTINANVVLGGLLDLNPVSSIFPAGGYARMEVLATSVPGVNYGAMFRLSGVSAYIWGSGPPNPFGPATSPSFNQDRIFAGEGFRYLNIGTGLGQTESIPVKFSDTTGFQTTTDTLVIHIQGRPVLSWTKPADIVYGTPLGAAQLNATANVPGTFAYSVPAGTVLAVGTHTLSVTFTPTDTATYTSATAFVTFAVLQDPVAGLGVSWGTAGTAALTTAADGLRLLPAGRSTDLPWLGINQLQITLSQAAALTPSDVSIHGIAVADYGPVTISGSGASYTITLAQPINAADRVTVSIGNASIATYTRRLDVLPGDVNDDGVVNTQDVIAVRNMIVGLQAATIYGDLDGNGIADMTDYNQVRRSLGTSLP